MQMQGKRRKKNKTFWLYLILYMFEDVELNHVIILSTWAL